ncbi:MAG: insulinase family protein [Gammaproteobacteria bacterium]|nr:insulinase family protein [Gammaproteobacteria bacterium]
MTPKSVLLALAGLALLAAADAGAGSAAAGGVDIPFTRFTLDNGLTVIVHEDRKAPIVAVGVWYHVGSKDERPGKTGFAHLFEHIMFEGSENHDDRFSKPLELVGATSLNGTTWLDRTNYFENVPTPALELALWLESDRMGHLLGVVTQEKLDQERGVVKNEKRQGDNQPYGKVNYRILEGLFPPGHPYRHSTIGSMDDLDAASLEDVHQWFRDYYGAANTVLVLAGDIDAATGKALAEKYFGHIPAGPPVTRLKRWVPVKTETIREVMYDRVPQIRSIRNWAVPGWTERDRALLTLAAHVLGDGKNARLNRALVYELQLATEVAVSVQPFELASLFSIDTTLAPDIALEQVDDIIDQEVERFLRDGPGEEELARARTKILARVVRGLERVGGFSGKATTLAQSELYDGDPGFFRTYLDWIEHATTGEVREAALRWIGNGPYQLDVLPFGQHRTVESGVDRSRGLPPVPDLPDLNFPEIQRAALANGLPVVLASRGSVPVVTVALQFDAGFAADAGRKPGTASFTLAMMDESTARRTALEIDAEAESLGARITTDSTLDTSKVTLSALAGNLDPSIELFADIVRRPAFANEELERLRKRWLANIEQEKNQPVSLALRTLPPLLYGPDHPYGIPFTGSGTADSIRRIGREDLIGFHRDWIRPDNATLFVVGDTDLEAVLPVLEKHFGDWAAPGGDRPGKSIGEVPPSEASRLVVIDKPGAPQSLILAAQLAPPTGVENNIELELMNDVIGGAYAARINQNLRVDKHWSYGAYTFFRDARGQRPWIIYAPVQTDRTADSLRELQDELRRFLGTHPATPDEHTRVFRSNAYSLPGRFETNGAVLGALLDNQRFERPDDYVPKLKARYEAVGLENLQAAAEQVLRPDGITWVVVGDRGEIEEELRALGIAEPEFMDTDGRLLPPLEAADETD